MTTKAQHEKNRKKEEWLNTGILRRNQDKDPNNPEHEKWSDYRGKADIGGVPYWIAGYIREGQYGKFLSLTFSHRDPRPEPREDAEAYRA